METEENFTEQNLPNSSIYLQLLEKANAEKANRYTPVVVFLTLIVVFGTVGNLFVLHVYTCRFKRRAAHYFIITMAVFDLFGCLVAMPLEIYDMRHPYTFYNSAGCKIFRFIETATTIASVIILLEIGFDRYVKICKPLRVSCSTHRIKITCICTGFVALVICIPTLVLFGISRVEIQGTSNYSIKGYDCSVEEQYKKSTFSTIYYAVLIMIFILTFGTLFAFYMRIWLEIKRRKAVVIGNQVFMNGPERQTEVNGNDRMHFERSQMRVKILPSTSVSDDDISFTRSIRMRNRSRLGSIAEYVTRIRTSKTTIILFCVTVAFLICYLPGMVVMICRSSIKSLDEEKTEVEDIVMKFFANLYLLSCAINPAIYSFLNANFRIQCVKALKKVYCATLEKGVFHTDHGIKIKMASESSNSSR